jgi:hypothetical protein
VCGAWCKGTGLGGKGRIGIKEMDVVSGRGFVDTVRSPLRNLGMVWDVVMVE